MLYILQQETRWIIANFMPSHILNLAIFNLEHFVKFRDENDILLYYLFTFISLLS